MIILIFSSYDHANNNDINNFDNNYFHNYNGLLAHPRVALLCQKPVAHHAQPLQGIIQTTLRFRSDKYEKQTSPNTARVVCLVMRPGVLTPQVTSLNTTQVVCFGNVTLCVSPAPIRAHG